MAWQSRSGFKEEMNRQDAKKAKGEEKKKMKQRVHKIG
jgi:hypothetical protein